MAAAAGATGARTWLQTHLHYFGWLTPKRLRAITLTMFVIAAGVSTVGLSGSSTPPPKAPAHHASASVR